MSTFVDLQAYFKRIGYTGSRVPNVETLHALTGAHTRAIAFENVDVLLGRRISLQAEDIFNKLVNHQRGGYCFEQNGLLLHVLQQLGFRARPLGARVRLRTVDRAILPRRTHMLIAVMLDGRPWLTDVGIGGASLTQALRLAPDVEQTTPHGARRLQQDGKRWFQQLWRDAGWHDVYEFTLDDFPLVDREVANWYTSTNPASHFCSELFAAIAQPDGRRATLFNWQLTQHEADGTRHERTLRSASELVAELQQIFHLVLTPADQELLLHKIGLQPPP